MEETKKKLILVIDDEEDVRTMLRVRLENSGYSVIEATDGEEGLEKCLKNDPDLILLDVMMPKKDGHTFLWELKDVEAMKKKPIIVITAKSGMEHFFRAEDVSDFVTKPFEYGALLVKIKKALGES